jgi:hypothetical protein
LVSALAVRVVWIDFDDNERFGCRHIQVWGHGPASWQDYIQDIDESPDVAGTGESILSKTASMDCRKRRV